MNHPVRCAHCLKAIKWRVNPPEIIFWKPGERPFGLHRGCEDAYQAGDPDEGNLWEARVARLG